MLVKVGFVNIGVILDNINLWYDLRWESKELEVGNFDLVWDF